MNAYRIRDWDKIYENNRSRELKTLTWVPIPVKLNGDGYVTLMEHKDGAAIFGAFVAIVELAANCNPRGLLVRGAGIPHSPATIARQTRMGVPLITKTLNTCCSNEINWFEIIDLETGATTSQDGATIPQQSATLSALQEGIEGIEKKEGKRRFAPPSLDEVAAYCFERKNNIDAQGFVDFYASKGWKVGNSPMKDWRAAVRTWELRDKNNPAKKTLAQRIIDKRKMEAENVVE